MQKDPYKDAGVDIEAGNTLVEQIKPAIKSTHRNGVMGGFGGFGSFFDPKAAGFKDPIFVSGTDGVGTKLKIALEMDKFDTIGIDLVAMCVNDLLVQGAEPLFFLDYYACGQLNLPNTKSTIEGIAAGCVQAGCALIGGETAEMPGLYQKDDFDLAGFAVGAVERDAVITGEKIKEGDILLGLASSGAHSNGYSLIRTILEKHASYADKTPFQPNKTFGDILSEPTKIYVKSVLTALRKSDGIHGMAHITGGGLSENIPRVLPSDLKAVISLDSWTRPAIFDWLEDKGNISEEAMLRTFNCGIGYVLAVAKEQVDDIRATLEAEGERVFEIGKITSRSQQEEPIKFI